MTKALVMAGGRSERMRVHGGPHKALVPVLGLTLLERNLRMLFSSGFRDVAVSVRADERPLLEYLENHAVSLAASYAATISPILEHQPLGTIGAARLVSLGSDDSLLVVNVDNLTSLDLRELVGYHEQRAAALTIASHTERFHIPFGELRVIDGSVDAYLEKPVIDVPISSGTYVLSARATSTIAPSGPTSLPELFERLRARGELVVAFLHDAPWIDVNDSAAVIRAEELVRTHRDVFEPWAKTGAL